VTKRAILLARSATYSSEQLLKQLESTVLVAIEKGWEIVDILVNYPNVSKNQALPRTTYNPTIEIYSQLRKHIENKAFDILVVADLNRIWRKPNILLQFVRDITDTGAEIYSLSEGWINRSNMHIVSLFNSYIEKSPRNDHR
jgi:hypothetical protein